MQRRAVGGDHGAEVDAFPHAHDRHAVLTEIARHDDVVAGPRPFRSDVHARWDHPDPGGVDEDLVGAAFGYHLGVAGDDADAGARGGLAHGLRDGAEHVEFQTLLEDEPGRQPDGLGSAASQIVDSAVDRQVSDVTAGEEKRLHHIGIRGQRDAPAGDVEQRRVPRHTGRTAECRQEEVFNQFLGQHTTAAVTEHDAFRLT